MSLFNRGGALGRSKKENNLKEHLTALFTGKAPFDPPVTFPQSHIIYAENIRHAQEIIKEGGYFVLSQKDVQFFWASATPGVDFKFATAGKTPAYSELGKGREGSKHFFAKDYMKLRVNLGEDGKTTDWILMRKARKTPSSGEALKNDIAIGKRALAGPMITCSLPGENNNYKKDKPLEGLRREKKRVRKALKNSPAFIRGRLEISPKKKGSKKGKIGEIQKIKIKVEEVTFKNTKVEEVTLKTTKVEEVTFKDTKVKELEMTARGGQQTKKPSKYFCFVKRVLDQKNQRRAEKRKHDHEEEEVLARPTSPKVEDHIHSSQISSSSLPKSPYPYHIAIMNDL